MVFFYSGVRGLIPIDISGFIATTDGNYSKYCLVALYRTVVVCQKKKKKANINQQMAELCMIVLCRTVDS